MPRDPLDYKEGRGDYYRAEGVRPPHPSNKAEADRLRQFSDPQPTSEPGPCDHVFVTVFVPDECYKCGAVDE